MILLTKDFSDFLFILADSSVDVFDYFKVDEMHGLNKKEASETKETEDDSYAAGWTNYIPNESGEYKFGDKPFLFINALRLKNNLKDGALIMHECVHIALLLHDWNLDKEEEIVTMAEEYANKIIDVILKEKLM